MEHSIIDKYSNMIAEEVNRYKNVMLDYFHARQIDSNQPDAHVSSSTSSSSSHQYYTTSLARITYELKGYMNNEFFTQKSSIDNDDEESRTSLTLRSSPNDRPHSKNVLYDQDQSQMQTFLTENSISTNEINSIPFYDAFRIPSNLVNTIMFK